MKNPYSGTFLGNCNFKGSCNIPCCLVCPVDGLIQSKRDQIDLRLALVLTTWSAVFILPVRDNLGNSTFLHSFVENVAICYHWVYNLRFSNMTQHAKYFFIDHFSNFMVKKKFLVKFDTNRYKANNVWLTKFVQPIKSLRPI